MYTGQQNNQNMKVQNTKVQNNTNDNNGVSYNNNTDTNDNNHSLIHLIRKFLDTRTETVLTFAAAVAIATAFKDLILSVITNIIHPLIVKLMLLTNLSNYVNISSLNTSQNIVTNLSQFVVNILSFVLILVITYYLFQTIINSK
jgi:large-conductance mechanosensitive channel